jgi:alpha-L-arabinofuranosidase
MAALTPNGVSCVQDLGHPKPFNLKLLGVGNEQWGEQYIERWKSSLKP